MSGDTVQISVPSLTIHDVARETRVGTDRIRKAIHAGELTAVRKSGRAGKWLCRPEWVQAWVDSWTTTRGLKNGRPIKKDPSGCRALSVG